MKLTTSAHRSDVLELNADDLTALARGEELSTPGLLIRKEIPDVERYYKYVYGTGSIYMAANDNVASLKLTYDGRTGKMLKAEILK